MPMETELGAGLESIEYHGMPHVSAGRIELVRTHAGAVRAFLSPAPPPAGLGAPGDDARIEAAVRGLFSTDPLLATADLDIDVNDGIVNLYGQDASRVAAARAVLVALQAKGVREVICRLGWATSTVASP
jgi:hypothetical protein